MISLSQSENLSLLFITFCRTTSAKCSV